MIETIGLTKKYGWQNLRLYVVNYGSVRLYTVKSTATYGTEVA